MTVGADQHIWYQKGLPPDGEHLFLAEMAGPRAVHRNILLENNTDVPLTVTLQYQAEDPTVEIGFASLKILPDNAVFVSEKGFMPSLGSRALELKGDPQVLGGSCPGIEVWLETEGPPTDGYFYAEISCQFDS